MSVYFFVCVCVFAYVYIISLNSVKTNCTILENG